MIDYFARKRRLWLEYALLAMVLAVTGLAVALWVTKARFEVALVETQTQLMTVWGRLVAFEAATQAQAQQLEAFELLRAQDAKALTKLYDSDAVVKKRLDALEIQNEAVRAYLQQPVPDDLRGVLRPAEPAE